MPNHTHSHTKTLPIYPMLWPLLLMTLFGAFLAFSYGSFQEIAWGASPPMTNPHEPYAPEAPPSGIIGVALHITAHTIGDPAKLYIRAIHPEGPAAKAGLNHGQEIVKVDDVPLSGKTYQEVVSMIRGVANTSVSLTLDGPNGIQTVKINRVDQDVLLEQKHRT